jgi:hypothetical protein
MKRRYSVLGLSLFLALALAVPAMGGPSNPVASVSADALTVAKKALKKAKAAQKTANSAQSAANGAQSTANSALGEAKKGVSAAAAAQTTADAAKKQAEEASAAAAAANENAETRIQGSTERSAAIASNTETTKGVSAFCEPGETVLGGGHFVGGTSSQVTVNSSELTLYGNGWFIQGQAISGTPTWSLTAYVMCGTR